MGPLVHGLSFPEGSGFRIKDHRDRRLSWIKNSLENSWGKIRCHSTYREQGTTPHKEKHSLGSPVASYVIYSLSNLLTPNLTQLKLNKFHMYPHELLEIYPMVHSLVGLHLNGVRCGLYENGVDPIQYDCNIFLRVPCDMAETSIENIGKA
jgi:hypothetical protein